MSGSNIRSNGSPITINIYGPSSSVRISNSGCGRIFRLENDYSQQNLGNLSTNVCVLESRTSSNRYLNLFQTQEARPCSEDTNNSTDLRTVNDSFNSSDGSLNSQGTLVNVDSHRISMNSLNAESVGDQTGTSGANNGITVLKSGCSLLSMNLPERQTSTDKEPNLEQRQELEFEESMVSHNSNGFCTVTNPLTSSVDRINSPNLLQTSFAGNVSLSPIGSPNYSAVDQNSSSPVATEGARLMSVSDAEGSSNRGINEEQRQENMAYSSTEPNRNQWSIDTFDEAARVQHSGSDSGIGGGSSNEQVTQDREISNSNFSNIVVAEGISNGELSHEGTWQQLSAGSSDQFVRIAGHASHVVSELNPIFNSPILSGVRFFQTTSTQTSPELIAIERCGDAGSTRRVEDTEIWQGQTSCIQSSLESLTISAQFLENEGSIGHDEITVDAIELVERPLFTDVNHVNGFLSERFVELQSSHEEHMNSNFVVLPDAEEITKFSNHSRDPKMRSTTRNGCWPGRLGRSDANHFVGLKKVLVAPTVCIWSV